LLAELAAAGWPVFNSVPGRGRIADRPAVPSVVTRGDKVPKSSVPNAAIARFLRRVLPRTIGAKHKQDACQRLAI
jgi:hypothetical protein